MAKRKRSTPRVMRAPLFFLSLLQESFQKPTG
jgi:hypothetical protein